MEVRKLNTLRGMAALIVLVSHYSNESGLWGGALGHGAGQFGVMIFFLLSAFLMAYIYLETPPTTLAIKHYAIARIARVVPLFLAVVMLCFAAKQSPYSNLGAIAFNINDIKSLIAHLLLLHGDNVLWTIPPEIHFYAIFACAWYLRPRLQRFFWLLPAMTLVSYSLKIWPAMSSTTIFGLMATFSITQALPYFIAGMMLGCAFRHWQPAPHLRSHWYLAALLLIPLLYPTIFLKVTGHSHGMWSDPGILACLIVIFFSVVFMVPQGNPLLENKAGDKIGEISYSLYLLHYPLLLALKTAGLATGVIGLVIFLLLSLALALTSFLLFEAPMRRYIKGLYLADASREAKAFS